MSLRDGLIWDFRCSAFFPGARQHCAPDWRWVTAAQRRVAIFNHHERRGATDDLEIRASMMRLQYPERGYQSGAGSMLRAQAELLRDTWVLGRVLSAVLWPVSKVFGTK